MKEGSGHEAKRSKALEDENARLRSFWPSRCSMRPPFESFFQKMVSPPPSTLRSRVCTPSCVFGTAGLRDRRRESEDDPLPLQAALGMRLCAAGFAILPTSVLRRREGEPPVVTEVDQDRA